MSVRYLIAVGLMIACTRLVTEPDEPLAPAASLMPSATAAAEPPAVVSWALPVDLATSGGQDPAHRLYDRISRELLRGDCDAAVEGYRLFLELYDRTALAPFAEFWQGECEFRSARYPEAVKTFDRVLNREPLPAKLVSAALMRKGLSYAKLGEATRSRHALELVVAQFPGSSAAETARQQLIAVLTRP